VILLHVLPQFGKVSSLIVVSGLLRDTLELLSTPDVFDQSKVLGLERRIEPV
jgi:hypothetical protein